MENQIRWNVTNKFVELEKELVSSVAELYKIMAEKKLNLSEDDPIVRQMDKINNTINKSCLEFSDCYVITEKTNLILKNIPIMN